MFNYTLWKRISTFVYNQTLITYEGSSKYKSLAYLIIELFLWPMKQLVSWCVIHIVEMCHVNHVSFQSKHLSVEPDLDTTFNSVICIMGETATFLHNNITLNERIIKLIQINGREEKNYCLLFHCAHHMSSDYRWEFSNVMRNIVDSNPVFSRQYHGLVRFNTLIKF